VGFRFSCPASSSLRSARFLLFIRAGLSWLIFFVLLRFWLCAPAVSLLVLLSAVRSYFSPSAFAASCLVRVFHLRHSVPVQIFIFRSVLLGFGLGAGSDLGSHRKYVVPVIQSSLAWSHLRAHLGFSQLIFPCCRCLQPSPRAQGYVFLFGTCIWSGFSLPQVFIALVCRES
jgi:hypothetical protein